MLNWWRCNSFCSLILLIVAILRRWQFRSKESSFSFWTTKRNLVYFTCWTHWLVLASEFYESNWSRCELLFSWNHKKKINDIIKLNHHFTQLVAVMSICLPKFECHSSSSYPTPTWKIHQNLVVWHPIGSIACDLQTKKWQK